MPSIQPARILQAPNPDAPASDAPDPAAILPACVVVEDGWLWLRGVQGDGAQAGAQARHALDRIAAAIAPHGLALPDLQAWRWLAPHGQHQAARAAIAAVLAARLGARGAAMHPIDVASGLLAHDRFLLLQARGRTQG